MTFYNNSIKYRFPIIALSLFVNACSTVNHSSNEDTIIKPDELTIEKSIIAIPDETRSVTSQEITERDIKAPAKVQSTESIKNIGGFGALEQAAKIPPAFENTEKVTISVDSMSVSAFIHYVFGDLLGLNYVISSQLEGNAKKVSLNLNDPIAKEILYTTSEELLRENDIAMLRKDNIIYFQKKNKDKRYTNALVGIGREQSDIPQSTGKIVQIIPYIYTNSRSLSSVIKRLTGIEVKINAKLRILTVEGSQNDILEVMRALRMLDVPSAVGKEIRLMELAYIAPDTLVDKLEELLINDGYAVGKDQDITFVTMPRLGGIVVYAVSLDAVERVELWSKKLDIAIAGNEPQFYIYRPQFNKAVDLQTSLSPIINTILGVSGNTNTSAPTGNQQSSGENGQSPTSSTTSSMTVDPVQNALIFYTTSDKYRKISQLLNKLDHLPGQVILDIAIAEVTLSDKVSSGIDWFYDSRGQSDNPSGGNILATDFISDGALSLTGFKGDWRAALNFIEQKTKVRVLAKPFMIVMDGESASINAGDQVPTVTQSSTSDTDKVTNSIQYVTTGIQVSVTPTINAKGLVNLSVSMSSSASKLTEGFEVATPTITNRTITTSIYSADGQTVALGGLIREDLDGTGNQVPFFGSIPFIGYLFRSDSDTYLRSELIMLITTRIVKSVNDIDEFRNKILDLYNFPLSKE
jgi:general secretion pathway protein D